MAATGREQRRLVDEVRQIGADHARRRRRDAVEVDVGREGDVARVHPQDRRAAVAVGRADGHAAVEAAGAEERAIEHVGPVRRADDDHAGRRVEAVHLGQDLVQRLLALVVAAAEAGRRRARAADRVELVDEDDRRRRLLRLLEEVADARRADADDRLDELRGRHREERDVRLAGDRAREQRLAGSRLAAQQDAVRDAPAELAVPVGTAEEVDDLRQLGLRLVDAGDVGEGDAVRLPARSAARSSGVNEPRSVCAFAPSATSQTSRPRKSTVGPKLRRMFSHHGERRLQRLGVDDDAGARERARERLGVGELGDLGLEAGRRLRAVRSARTLEGALDRRALRGDLGDVAGGDLMEEERAVGDANACGRLRRAGAAR